MEFCGEETIVSIENAREFIEHLKKNPALRQSIKNAEDKVEVVKGTGFVFTMEEWGQAKKEYIEKRCEDRELSDEEIARVAGGVSCYCFDISCYCFSP